MSPTIRRKSAASSSGASIARSFPFCSRAIGTARCMKTAKSRRNVCGGGMSEIWRSCWAQIASASLMNSASPLSLPNEQPASAATKAARVTA